jgi:putative phosphoribosyl transferase
VTVVERIFLNRREAGAVLGQRLLSEYGDRSDIVVLAIPRGGVPVGFEIAQALHAPLDVLVVRKLGVPSHEELAMGAIATGEVTVVNREVVQALSIPETEILRVKALEQIELNRRELAYRGSRSPLPVHGKTVIIVDDGLATGSTMRAAVMATRQREPAKVVVAVPVSSIEACDRLMVGADEVVCVQTPSDFSGVGQWYQDFVPTSDAEVRELMEHALRAHS